ncbi:MAG: peptide ABC transporter substrate-binding protein [Patescibacteria group bacterium]
MRNFKLPSKKEINFVFASFSKREWTIFAGFTLALLLSTILMLQSINKYFMVTVPLRGGSIALGIVGTPRFINPILANSEADLDLVTLIYSGLMRKGANGTLLPDLAEKYEMSKNGLIYTFTLKNDLYFQDGKPITTDDILFTIDKVKNSIIKSPQKVNWDGVSVEKINEKIIKFTLKQPYASFLENTTLGIMPAHLWDNTPLELNNTNTNPIGSGPYMINSISKKSSGIIDYYKLTPFKKFILGEPYIKNINLHFYQNEDDLIQALFDKKVEEINSITPLNAKNLKERNYKVESAVLPRVFGLFFNQNVNRLFTDKAVVTAINQAIDKDRIIRDVLFGYGVAIDNPIPPNMMEYQKLTVLNNISRQEKLQKAQNDLAKDGWKMGLDGFLEKTTTEKKKKVTTKLEFSISTGNVPELTKTAEFIKKDLADIGIKVQIKTFETGNLNQSVIRPRKYDALLFGEIINHESDLFAFWHSSQRKDPGFNVAMYTNAKVDKILEDASVTIDEQERIKKYTQFKEEIAKDMPAIFLFSPNFIYVVSKNLKEIKINDIATPSDRYLNAYSWYIQTENIWKIFGKYQP